MISSVDTINIITIKVYRELREKHPDSKLILQVHDELIIEAPENEKDAVLSLLVNEMKNAYDLKVTLEADASWGRSWYECK